MGVGEGKNWDPKLWTKNRKKAVLIQLICELKFGIQKNGAGRKNILPALLIFGSLNGQLDL